MIYCIAALFFVLGVIVGRAHERRRKSKIIARQREILVETLAGLKQRPHKSMVPVDLKPED